MLATRGSKMDTSQLILLIFTCIFVMAGETEAKRRRGNINTEQDFVFLDGFQFSDDGGNKLDYEIRYPVDQCCYRLALFDETSSQWVAIRSYEDRLTCSQKLDRITDIQYNIKLSERDEACFVENSTDTYKWLVCRGHMDFTDSKPSWRFIHLTNCGNRRNARGLWNVTYTLHMTNGKHGISREFSADEKYILEVVLIFFMIYMAMIVVATHFRFKLSKKKLLHLSYRLFYYSLLCQTFFLFLNSVAFINYARFGFPANSTRDFGTPEVVRCLADIFFVTMLLLVAKGFSITRATISFHGTVKTVVFAFIFTASYVVAFVYQHVILDLRDVILIHTMWSASGIIIIKFSCIAYLMYGVFFTIKDHPRKAKFYIPFAFFFFLWFSTEPVAIFLSAYGFPALRSANTTTVIQCSVSWLGHIFFLYLTRPHVLNDCFPFHLQVNKVGIRIGDDDEDHPYRPTSDFFSISVINDKSSRTIKDPVTILDLDRFETPVTPFNPDGDDDAALPIRIPIVGTETVTMATERCVSPPHDGYANAAWPSIKDGTGSGFGALASALNSSNVPADFGKQVNVASTTKAEPPSPCTYSYAPVAPAPYDGKCGNHRINPPKGGYEIFCVEKPKTQAPTEAVVPAAAEDQTSTPVAKPDHAASGATEKSAQKSDTSSYAPVAPAPFVSKSKYPYQIPKGGFEIFCVEKPKPKAPTEAVVPAAAEDQTSTPVAKPDHAASGATEKSAHKSDTSSYAPVAPAPFVSKSKYPYQVPKGGFEIFCVEKPKPKAPTEAVVPEAAEVETSTPVAKPDHAASGATEKSAQKPDTSSYAPVAPAPIVSKSKYPYQVPKGGFEIFCVETPKPKNNVDQPATIVTVGAGRVASAPSCPRSDVPVRPDPSTTASAPVTAFQTPSSHAPVAPVAVNRPKFGQLQAPNQKGEYDHVCVEIPSIPVKYNAWNEDAPSTSVSDYQRRTREDEIERQIPSVSSSGSSVASCSVPYDLPAKFIATNETGPALRERDSTNIQRFGTPGGGIPGAIEDLPKASSNVLDRPMTLLSDGEDESSTQIVQEQRLQQHQQHQQQQQQQGPLGLPTGQILAPPAPQEKPSNRVSQAWLPAADKGDTRTKARKEPSFRRFAPPSKAGQVEWPVPGRAVQVPASEVDVEKGEEIAPIRKARKEPSFRRFAPPSKAGQAEFPVHGKAVQVPASAVDVEKGEVIAPIRKTKKEPSFRRFAPPSKAGLAWSAPGAAVPIPVPLLGLGMDIDQGNKIADPSLVNEKRSKKRRFKRFLKMAKKSKRAKELQKDPGAEPVFRIKHETV